MTIVVDQDPPLQPTAVDRTPPRAAAPALEVATLGRFALLLGVFIAAAFPEVVFGTHTFFFRDFSLFGYPLAHYHRECFWRGELPLWNPLNDCGVPFLAQWNTMTLYPLSLFYLVFPLSWSLGIFCLGHLFLGGMGAYRLARRWTGNDVAASVAGLAFAFNGLSLNCLMWPNNIAALGWMPWVILSVERGVRDGGRNAARAVLIGTVQMLSGAPEIILFTWTISGLMSLGQTITDYRTRAHQAQMIVRCLATPLLRLGAIVGLVAGCSAAQLLPFLDLLTHSHREVVAGTDDWAMPLWGWINLILPLFRSAPGHFGVHFQLGQYWTSSYYVGVAVFVLGTWAAFAVKDWRARMLGAVVLFSLLLALGSPGYLYAALKQIAPSIAGMRYPVKFVVLTVFALPLLAGLGAARLLETAPHPRRGLNRSLTWTATAAAIALLVCLWFDRSNPVAGSSTSAVMVNAVSRVALLAFCGVVLWRLHQASGSKAKTIAWVALMMGLWLDALTHTPRQNPTAPRWVYEAGLVDAFLPKQPNPSVGLSRAMVTPHSHREFQYSYIPDPTKYCPSRRAGMFANLNLLEGIPKTDGFYSLYPKAHAELALVAGLTMFNAGPTNKGCVAGLIDFLAVSHSSSSTNSFSWEENVRALPLVTGGQHPVYATPQDTIAAICSERFDPRRVVYLPASTKTELTGIKPAKVNVTRSKIGSHKLEFEVAASDRAMIVVAQNYFHNWRCYIDGSATPLRQVNYAFTGLITPAGVHKITLAYEDQAFRVGCVISLLSLASCLLFWRTKMAPPLNPEL